MNELELLSIIKDYVDDVIQMNINNYRFNPQNLTMTFKAWAETYLKEYSGDDKIKHSTIRELIAQIDAFHEFQLIDQSNLLLNRCKWITPITQTIPESGSIPLIAAVQNLTIEGEGVIPTFPNATPLEFGFSFALDLLPGSIGLNITDNIWYYNDGTTIRKLMDSFVEIPTSQIAGLDATLLGISGRLDALDSAVGAIQQTLSNLQESINAIILSIPVADDITITNTEGVLSAVASPIPDMETIDIVDGKLHAIMPNVTVPLFVGVNQQTGPFIGLKTTREMSVNEQGELSTTPWED